MSAGSVTASLYYNDTGRDPDADTGDGWLESLMFIEKQGAGKRQVEDRQKFINQVRVQKVHSVCWKAD